MLFEHLASFGLFHLGAFGLLPPAIKPAAYRIGVLKHRRLVWFGMIWQGWAIWVLHGCYMGAIWSYTGAIWVLYGALWSYMGAIWVL